MAKKIKLTRKQIKQPDEFIDKSEKLWDWAEENVNLLVLIIVGGILLLLLIRLGATGLSSRSDAPLDKLSEAISILEAPAGIESAMSMPGMSRGYATEQEKYESAANSFQAIVDEYGGTRQGSIAILYLANSKEKLASYDEAISLYQDYLDSKIASLEPSTAEAAKMGSARCNFLSGNYKQALENYSQLVESESFFKAEAMIGMARSRAMMGEFDKSSEVMAKLRSEFPKTWSAQPSDFLAKYWQEKKLLNEKVVEDESSSSVSLEKSFEEDGPTGTALPELNDSQEEPDLKVTP